METDVCEICGREYVVTSFNSDAPFPMCDDCYEEYLISRDTDVRAADGNSF